MRSRVPGHPFIRRLVQSRASSSSAISCRWNTATWADVRGYGRWESAPHPAGPQPQGALSEGSSGALWRGGWVSW